MGNLEDEWMVIGGDCNERKRKFWSSNQVLYIMIIFLHAGLRGSDTIRRDSIIGVAFRHLFILS